MDVHTRDSSSLEMKEKEPNNKLSGLRKYGQVKSPLFVPVICNTLRKSLRWLRTSGLSLQHWPHNGEPIFLLLLVTGKA